MQTLLKFLVLTLLALPLPLAAQEDIDFTDWFAVTAALQTRGVDLTRLDGLKIETLCLPQKTVEDASYYHLCKYEKSLLNRDFNNDRSSCERRSGAVYPDRLNVQRPIRTYTVTDASGGQRVVQEFGDPLAWQEIELLRQSEIDFCMRSLGWADAQDWGAGRR